MANYKKLLTRTIIEEDFVSPNLFPEEEPNISSSSGLITVSPKIAIDYSDLKAALSLISVPKSKTKKKKKVQQPKPVVWKQVSSPTKAHLHKVRGSSQGLFFCGDQETILLKRPKYPIRLWNKGENDSNQLFDFWVGKDSIFPEVFLHYDGRIRNADGEYSKTFFDDPVGLCGTDEDHLWVLNRDGYIYHGSSDQEPEDWVKFCINSYEKIPKNQKFTGIQLQKYNPESLIIFGTNGLVLSYEDEFYEILSNKEVTNKDILTSYITNKLKIIAGRDGMAFYEIGNKGWIPFYSSYSEFKKVNFYDSFITETEYGYLILLVGSYGTILQGKYEAKVNQMFVSRLKSNTDKGLISIWGTGSNDIWACGENGTVIHYGNE